MILKWYSIWIQKGLCMNKLLLFDFFENCCNQQEKHSFGNCIYYVFWVSNKWSFCEKLINFLKLLSHDVNLSFGLKRKRFFFLVYTSFYAKFLRSLTAASNTEMLIKLNIKSSSMRYTSIAAISRSNKFSLYI